MWGFILGLHYFRKPPISVALFAKAPVQRLTYVEDGRTVQGKKDAAYLSPNP